MGEPPEADLWCFADVWERMADIVPARPAVHAGGETWTYEELEKQANGLAFLLMAHGAQPGQAVTAYMRNCPEYVVQLFAAFKLGMVPVNTNFRYRDDELTYLWSDADVTVVMFSAEFMPNVARVRDRLPAVALWVCVGDPDSDLPDWAVPYDRLLATTDRAAGPRSGRDLLLLYTGGTTGYPKGVQWRQDDMFWLLNRAAAVRFDPARQIHQIEATALARRPVRVVPCPLMHGTGLFAVLITLSVGGEIVLTGGRGFDPGESLDLVVARAATELAIVGDAFAMPLRDALQGSPARWDLSSLRLIVSSGAAWSSPVKSDLQQLLPNAHLVDIIGASETSGLGSAHGTGGGHARRFALSPVAQVIRDDGSPVAHGTGEIGMLATTGRIPLGYHKDPARTESTFRQIDGTRWAVTGDLATVDADGMVTILGRATGVINTGGEKVFAEEVELVLKRHSAVQDAAVIPLPDERLGQAVVAVVAVGDHPVGTDELADWVRRHLASYKTPRHVFLRNSLHRMENGKLDLPRLTSWAEEQLSGQPIGGGTEAAR